MDKFFDVTRAFFAVAYNYYLQWLPIDDEFLKACIFVDFGKRNRHFPKHRDHHHQLHQH